ncbi:hypothetical protein SLS60_005987 [Paraconiothyrium brasiliense]|uniref:Uncharacterized protein n=1 Tax=Paraconiothyrium brasiliense TaxID=300254 RepID=A0ABR3RDR3_9PLEO
MDHIAETPPPETREKLTLHRVEKIQPSTHVERFKMRNSESPECKTGDAECVGENVDIHQDSEASDIQDITFEEIEGASVVVQDLDRLVVERESPSNLDQSNAGNDVDEFSENKHKPPKSHDAAPSIQGHLSTEDDFTEHNYLEARAAAGEPTILSRDMLDRLREKVKADEERRRKGDPRYQHEIMLAKVNAAQAKREADVPNDVLYPEANDKRAHGEKCFLDMEQWDLLEEFEVQDQPDQDDGLESIITLRPDYKAGGSEGFPSDVSMSSAAPSRFGTMYGWVSKAGNVFASKRVSKEPDGPKPMDRQKNGWTLADVLEEDEAIFSR